MGRWSTLRIQIKGTVLSVITVYRVCKTPVTLESNTAYSQQWREWKTKTEKKVDPRERTLQDLKKYVKGEIEKKREVVVLIDANESIDSRTEEMNQFIHECGLVDTHLIKDPYDEVETYVRGKDKIDFALVTPRVQQCISYSHIAPYNETIISDHRALIVDIDYKLMEAGELTYWQRPERSIQSTSLSNRRKFVADCHERGERLRWLERIEEFQMMATKEVEEALNHLDTEVTQVFTSSAEKRKSKPKPPGSAKLNGARLQHLLWRIASKGVKNRRNFTHRLNQIARKLGISENQDEWRQPRTVASNLRKSNKLRRQYEKEAFSLKAKEKEENTIRNIPDHKNKESALREITHRMKQKYQFRQIRDSVRKATSGGITHIIHPEPYQGYPYNPEEVNQWKEEHDQEKLEKSY